MSKRITVVGTECPSSSVDWFKELMGNDNFEHKLTPVLNHKVGARCDANIRCTNKDLTYCEHCNLTLCKQHWG